MDTKLESARLAGSAKGGGRGKGSTSAKKDAKVSAPPIHIWFRTQWKENEEETISKYCDEDSAEAVKKSVLTNPTTKNKKGDALKTSIAGAYYTKHFSKRGAPTYQEEGHAALKKAHDELKASLEKGEGEADADADADADTESKD